MKKSLLFALCALLLPIVANAYNFSVDGIYYNKNSDGTSVTVTYKTTSYNSYSGSVVIPVAVTYSGKQYNVTSIGREAFYNCSSLTSITIPNSVTSIGNFAFESCSGLTSVTISESVTSIGGYAFEGCTGLTSITIPNSVTSIGEAAFSYCKGLTSVTIPSSVTSVGEEAFRSCSNLTSIVVEKDNTYYDSRDNSNAIIQTSSNTLISGCKNTVIPSSVTSIGNKAFYNCSGLTSITIPESVTSIGNNAFYNCTGLTSITIPESVTSIGESAFQGCSSLTSITIPNSVTSIGDYAFYNTAWYNNQPDGLIYAGKVAYKYKGTMPDGTEIVIKDGTTEICSSAFSGCSNLTFVSIPNSVTSIGIQAFYNCSGLTSVTIPNSVTSIGEYAFSGTGWFNNQPDGLIYAGKVAYTYKGTIPEGTQIDLDEGTLGIASGAFQNCFGLTSVTIPNSVTCIADEVFEGCTGLTSVIIPNSVTSIGEEAFEECTGLTSVIIPNSVTSIGKDAFRKSGIKSLFLPESVSSIGRRAFSSCAALTSITIPNSLISINDYAFAYCSSLTSITIGNSVTSIGEEAIPSNAKIYVNKGTPALIAVWNYGRSPYDLSTNTLLPIPTISKTNNSASSLQLFNSSSLNGVQFASESFTVNGVTKVGPTASITGLTPNTTYSVQYSATIKYEDRTVTYNKESNISTEALTLTTTQPKVISLGNAVVGATSNLDDAEENIGFEWRRTDWTEEFASNTGAAYLYEGTMEGYIRNLYTEKLWKVRPYYKSNDGKFYYGEWVGLDPTNTSYFEPTVHTYARIDQTENKVQISGYVQRGTDDVSKQGFKYWVQEDNARGACISIPSGAKTIEAKGRVMEVELTGLLPNTTYSYVAFVTTTEGETFYGKQLSFTTGDDPAEYVVGDANGNGEVEIGDVTSVLTLMATPEATGYDNKAADANGNGEIEIGDVTTILTIMAGN